MNKERFLKLLQAEKQMFVKIMMEVAVVHGLQL